MSLALYRKWRPARFDDVIGQEHVTRTLRNAVVGDRVGHAYLFCGPRGTGKTTSARLLAKAVNCTHDDLHERPCNTCANCIAINEGRFLDLIEIDAASNTGVDDIRSLRDKINYSPSEGSYKVYIIDEVHMLSTAAFNALLKTLEEPPAHAIFVMATTEEHKVPLTIKSRCQQFNFRLLTLPEITQRLEWLAVQESLSIEPEALALVARHGAGSLRDAESLLDQLVMAPADTITAERAQMVLGTATAGAVRALTQALLAADSAAGLKIIHESLATGADARQFCRQMVSYLRYLLLLQTAGKHLAIDLPPGEVAEMLEQARNADRRLLVEAIKQFNEAAVTPGSSWQPQLPLELAFIEALPALPVAPAVFTSPPVVAPEPAGPTASVDVTGAESAVPPAASEEKVSTESVVPPAVAKDEVSAESVVPPAAVDKTGAADVPPAAQQSAAAPPAGVDASLQTIQSLWPQLIQQVGMRDRNLPPLLHMCKPLATEQNTLIIGFDYPILRDKFTDKPENQTIVADVLTSLVGKACTVRAVATTDYTPLEAPTVTRAAVEALADELGGVVKETK